MRKSLLLLFILMNCAEIVGQDPFRVSLTCTEVASNRRTLHEYSNPLFTFTYNIDLHWKTRFARLRNEQGADLQLKDDIFCTSSSDYPGQMVEIPAQGGTQEFSSSDGFPLNSNIWLWLQNDHWKSNDNYPCSSFNNPPDIWEGPASVTSTQFRVSNVAPGGSGVEGFYSFTANSGEVTTTYNYDITYYLDAVAGALVYEPDVVCVGEQYTIKLPYKNGFSNGLFLWQRQNENGTWEDYAIYGNTIPVGATNPATPYRARLLSDLFHLGDNNNDPNAWRETNTAQLKVLNAPPTDISYVSRICEDETQPQLVLTGLDGEVAGAKYEVAIKKENGLNQGSVIIEDIDENTFPYAIDLLYGVGTYQLTFTSVPDNGGVPTGQCSRVFDATVRSVAKPQLTVSSSPPVCVGENGTLSVSVDAFTGVGLESYSSPYQYNVFQGGALIESVQSTEEVYEFSLPPGEYSVRVTDDALCESDSYPITIEQEMFGPVEAELSYESRIIAPDGTPYDASCGDQGLIGVIPSGGKLAGQPLARYNIRVYDQFGILISERNDVPEGEKQIMAAASGENLVEISDLLDCSLNEPVFITLNTPPVESLGTESESSPPSNFCSSNGFIAFFGVFGGLPPYEVYLNDILIFDTLTAPFGVIDTLSAGLYQVKIIDALGCEQIEQIDLRLPGMQTNAFSIPTSCYDISDGIISISPQGGNDNCGGEFCNYFVSLDGGPVIEVGDYYEFENLARGDHLLEMTDEEGCQLIEVINVGSPPKLEITRFEAPAISCNGSSSLVKLYLSGLSVGDTYRLIQDGVQLPEATFSGGPDLEFLSVGTYNYELEYDGCTSDPITITLTEPTPFEVNLNNIVSPNCPGDNSGRVTINMSGGNGAPFEIALYSDEFCEVGDVIEPAFNADQYTITNLAPGTYCITVRDRQSCWNQQFVTIEAPQALNINVLSTTDPSRCLNDNGSVTLAGADGISPYTYSSDGYFFIPSAELSSIDLIDTVFVQDSRGCVASTTISLNPFSSGLTVDQVTVLQGDYGICGGSGGKASFRVSGFAPPLTVIAYDCNTLPDFSISPEENPVVSPGDTTINLSSLPAGDHCYQVFDGTGCSQLISIFIDSPTPLSLSIDGKMDESCWNNTLDGSFSLSASGGVPPYTYTVDTFSFTTSGAHTFTGLSVGQYALSVMDAIGCSVSLSDSLLANKFVSAQTNYSPLVGCPGIDLMGGVEVIPYGGTPPYTVDWPDGITTDTRMDLLPGTYMTTISDVSGCPSIFGIYIPDVEPISLSIVQISDVSCPLQTDGSVNLSAEAGFGGYEYSLNGVDYQTSASFTGLEAGAYTGYAIDSNGCTSTVDFNIQELSDLGASTAVNDVSCFGASDGSITINPTGSTAPYTYRIDGGNPQASNVFADLGPGNYTVSVEDAQGCSLEFSNMTIVEAGLLTASAFEIESASCGLSNGTAVVVPAGGTPPFSYVWDNDPTLNSDTVNTLGSGPHQVEITDANGCTTLENLIISDTPPPVIASFFTTDESCGQSDGSATVFVSSGTPPFTYEWDGDPNLDNVTLENAAAGPHSVVVTDNRGCTVNGSVTIGSVPDLIITQSSSIPAACAESLGSASVVVGGGLAPYTYEWEGDPMNDQPTLENLIPGDYEVLVTDDNGCTTSQIVTVGVVPEMTLIEFESVPEACGQQDGEALVVFSGGTPPYSYVWNENTNLDEALVTGLSAGPQIVAITDARGCTATFGFELGETEALVLVDISSTPEYCDRVDGTATVVVDGGTLPYSYVWDGNPQFDEQSLINAFAGPHSVEVTDSRGCTLSANVIIEAQDGVMIDSTAVIDAACSQNNGSIEVFASNGEAPYSYIWSFNAQTGDSPIAENLLAGVYSVTVVDANLCEDVTTATVSPIPEMSLLNGGDVQPETCGLADGSISVEIVNGNPPFQYFWGHDPGLSGPVAENLTAGSYNLYIIDDRNCTLFLVFEVASEGGPVATVANLQPANCGQDDGLVSIGVMTGTGTPPFNYEWSDDNTINVPTRNDLAVGDYSVTLTDANGCIDSISVSVTTQNGVEITDAAIQPATCAEDNGSILLSTSNGQTPYQYQWSAPIVATGPLANNLAPGTYEVTVTDNDGCSAIAQYTVEELPPPVLMVDTFINSFCENGLGEISLEVAAGEPPFTYSWSHDVFAEGPVQTDLLAGPYSITVTDANGCESIVEQELLEVSGPTASLLNVQAVGCDEVSTGSIEISTSGGTAPFDYQWSHDASLATSLAQGLAPGNYSVTVTDENDCSTVLETTIEQIVGPALALGTLENTCTGLNNGSIEVLPSGGLAPFAYAWSHDPAINAPLADDLFAGSYTVTITDANGCQALYTDTITTANDVVASSEVTDGFCEPNAASMQITASGGNNNYTYAWSHESSLNSPLATSLSGGSYTVTITDTDGCSTIVSDTIIELPSPQVSLLNSTPSDCSVPNGSLSIEVSGGAGVYDILWTHDPMAQGTMLMNLAAGVYTVNVTDTAGCLATADFVINSINAPVLSLESATNALCGGNTGSATVTTDSPPGDVTISWAPIADPNQVIATGPTAIELEGGNYLVTATALNGCESFLTVTIEEVAEMVLTANSTPACANTANGNAEVGVSMGGTPPFSYQWEGGQSGPVLSDLGPGNYSLTVTDANGCSVSSSVEIIEQAAITATTSSTMNSCAAASDGTATVMASGGSGTYSYQWNDINAQLSATAINLMAGNYSVTITDQFGCSLVETVTVLAPDPLVLTLSEPVTPPSCDGSNGGQASVAASGGSGDYAYQWDDPLAQTTATATNLSSGDYIVTLTDGNGCQTILPVVIPEVVALSANVTEITPPTCHDTADGVAGVTVTAGNGNYQYQWDDPTSQTTATAVNLAPGNYNLTITDAFGCTQTISLEIPTTPELIISSEIVTDPSCADNSDGSIEVSIAGGTGAYLYSWSVPDAPDAPILTNLTGGTYSLTVTDENGCSTIRDFSPTAPPPIVFDPPASIAETCFGDADGQATALATGGSGTLSYQWNDPSFQTTPTAINLPPGTYQVVVTDQNGCQQSQEVAIGAAAEILSNFIEVSPPACNGDDNGSITVSPSGGAGNFTFAWNDLDGQNTPSATGLIAATYVVTITDQNGCSVTVDTVLTDPDLLEVTLTPSPILCVDGFGEILAQASGGTGAYNYSWNDANSQNSQTAIGLIPGDYSLTLTDENNCSTVETIELEDISIPIEIVSTDIVPSQCANASTGQISVVANGGNGPLVYNWSTGDSGSSLINLAPDSYTLTISDANGCEETISLEVPTLSIEGLDLGAADTSICNGEFLYYNFSAFTNDISWTSDNGFASTDAEVLLEEAGTYQLVADLGNGCTFTDAINLSIGDASFQALYVAPTDIIAGDTVAVVEVSWPMPTAVVWLYDSDSILLIDSFMNESYFVFPYPGTYSLGMEASLEDCTDWISKTIRVYPDSASLPEPLPAVLKEILEFNISPNPNNGNFSVNIELANQNDAILDVYDINGNPITRWVGQEATSYNPSFDLDLSDGAHVLILQVRNQRVSLVFMVSGP